ncbi:HAD-IIB family hydrolase [Limnobacter sp.]|uniref:HAD-IIB family hydrolase n=1 Tax=Limnobacter sp. TaxID=2003368 RepID=UPI002E374FA3|nr:HAD-IIB family hydrolase [Limnobacter sp.]
MITNRESSSLMNCVSELLDVSTHVFPLTKKDGYLATNSLLLDAVIVARAYGELDQQPQHVPNAITDLSLNGASIKEWLSTINKFLDAAVARRGIIVVYSPQLRPVAADLESKLSEAALLYCQSVDLRSFAHGRHLWLADRPQDCAVLAITEPSLQGLWEDMSKLFPAEVPTLTMSLAGAKPRDLITGLIAQMHLISEIARRLGKDPGRPDVPQFGRDLYYVDLPSLIPSPDESSLRSEQSKFEVLGARWPSATRLGLMSRAAEHFDIALQQQSFRAIVFDYDGTLCSPSQKDRPPSDQIVSELNRLLNGSIRIGVASGRGDSVQKHLQNRLPKESWHLVHLGLYNGGWIGALGDLIPEERETSEFLSHVTRIARRLKSLGVPIEQIRPTLPYQVSVRFRDGVQAENMWYVVADALRQAGLDLSSVVRSKHSVDILGRGVNKSHLIAHMVQRFNVDPYEILTMGDQGAWPGNDASLLEHRFSLSVDQPSRRLDRGWKMAPQHKRDVDATLWYLERININSEGTFNIST